MVVEILNDYQRNKKNNNNDYIFYDQPRFVNHLNPSFRSRLTNLYREKITEDAIILDLMSSWNSHLPQEIKYKRVFGHGLNKKELESNKRLYSYWVQDFNTSQDLPLEDSSIDVCLMVAAWQYLQYPEKIALELKRVVKPQGLLIVSFSNRAFWIKSPRIWIDGTDMDRINYIKNVLNAQGWSVREHILEETQNNTMFFLMREGGDPFLSVIASNN